MRITVSLSLPLATAALTALAPHVTAGDPDPLALVPVVAGPSRPTGIHHAGDGSGRLFLLSKEGTISIFDGNSVLPTPFLDLSGQIIFAGSERGLHGLAFHPDYASNGLFYVQYTDVNSDSVLSRFSVSADPDVADASSEEVILFIEQPHEWHNVSQLQFGPNDGYLYIGAGDGGSIGDPDNRAQDLGDLLGKILRIDVDGGTPYAIPPDNPFIAEPGARPEIWAYGVRNPWRFSFDRETGDLYMGDVGQFTWEEINFQPGGSPGGENYGWRLMEGSDCYDPPVGCGVPGVTRPIFEHEHGLFGGACAVIGGYTYRSSRFPRFDGSYFYGDFCSGEIWKASRPLGEWENPLALESGLTITTFGEDEDGELYVADDADGMIYQLIDPIPFCDIEASQPSYEAGELVAASTAKLANLSGATAALRIRLIIQLPNGSGIILVDIGADGSFLFPSGVEFDYGPLPLAFVPPTAPPGNYNIICIVDDPVGGGNLHTDVAPFAVQ